MVEAKFYRRHEAPNHLANHQLAILFPYVKKFSDDRGFLWHRTTAQDRKVQLVGEGLGFLDGGQLPSETRRAGDRRTR